MSWMMDGNWRVDVDEGPYDTLEVYMKGSGRYSIFRGPPTGPYSIRHDDRELFREKNLSKARKLVENRAKERKDA